MDSTTERQQYRALVQEVAARAATILPQAVNGRIAKAVTLVLAGDVQPQDDGTVTVYSATDATRRYILQGSSCTCADYERRQAPEGWCAHKIAANLHTSVERVLARRAHEEISAHSTEVLSDSTIVESAAHQPLPEAAFSLTLKGNVGGQDALLTVRGMTAAEFQANLDAIRGLLDTPPAPSQPPAVPQEEPRWCPKHGDKMRLNTKEGRQWHSHRLATGEYCKGK